MRGEPRALSAGEDCPSIRALTATLIERARGYLSAGQRCLEPLEGHVLPDCAFVLELTICLNRETLNRLEHLGGDPFPRRHFLQHDEKHAVAQSVACRTGFEAFGR